MENESSPPAAPSSSPPIAARAVAPGSGQPQIIIQQSPGRFSRYLAWAGWMGLLFCLPILFGMTAAYKDYFDTSGGIQEKYHSLNQSARDKIAVIDVSGIILEGDGFVKKQIDRVKKDKHIKAAVIRVNSPGGSVAGSDYIYHHLVQLREEKDIPLVVSMGSIAASGGYYVAMAVGDQEQSVYAEPTTTTGSIGVIIPHYDVSGLLERLAIKDDSIVSHPRKQLLSMTKPVTEDDRVVIQRYLDEAFARFKEICKSGRPSFRGNEAALNEVATGEIFSAPRAQALGLVDKIGFVEEAIARSIELAGLDKEEVRVVTYKRPPTVLEAVGMARAPAVSLDSMLLSLCIPKAYYLATTLPPMWQGQLETK